MKNPSANQDESGRYLRLALRLAKRGLGTTSPNPMVGAVLVKQGQIIGQGWHHQAGMPHAEIEALQDARQKGENPDGATLYVTLEPCCTHGRTPPCATAIIQAGISKVVAAATDPNPAHAGRAFPLLQKAGIQVQFGVLADQVTELNEAFNHWIVHRTPWVTVKAAMSLDGKIATRTGESKWITGTAAGDFGMKLRRANDAILAGINTILADNPALTYRSPHHPKHPPLRRIILDSKARTPLASQVVSDEFAQQTTVVVIKGAPVRRIQALEKHVQVWQSPARHGQVDIPWLLTRLGQEQVTSLLVEGGGEIQGSFLLAGMAHRIAFFYAPIILGGRTAPRAVAGPGAENLSQSPILSEVHWRRFGPDWLLTAKVCGNDSRDNSETIPASALKF